MSGIQCSFQRCEKKYFLTPAQQQALLAVMADHTRRDVYGEYTICSTYYDTEDWRLIRASIEKPAYKEKLRMRSYGTPAENGKVFAELKKKCGGVVYKRRITATPGPGGDPAGPPCRWYWASPPPWCVCIDPPAPRASP